MKKKVTKKVVKKSTKKNQSINTSNYIMLIGILTLVMLVSNILVDYYFEFWNMPIVYSVFSFPVVFMIANIITKKYGSTKTITALFIVVLIQAIFFCINNQIGVSSSLYTSMGSIVAFGLSQLVNLIIYTFLLKTKNVTLFTLFTTYFIVLLLDSVLFTYIVDGMYNITFLYSMSFRLAIAFILSYLTIKFDKK